MLRMVCALFLLFSFLLPSYASLESIDIVKVCDGDTIKVRCGGEVFNLRLAGIDCYETGKINRAYKQAYLDKITIEEVVERGKFSKEYLRKRLQESKDFKVKITDTGRYGRPVGILYSDGVDMNSELIRKGGCFPY